MVIKGRLTDYSATMDANEVRAALVGAIAQNRANATELSRRAGRNQGYVSDFLKRRKDSLDAEVSAFLETELGLPTGTLVVTNRRPALTIVRSSNPKLADRQDDGIIPVFAAAEGGTGVMAVSTDPIEWVARPWYLKNVREGYAVLVVGESMEPRYSPGEIVVVNPKAALVRGKDCIVTTPREGGDFRAMLKSYAGATDDAWNLRQLNPERAFSVLKREWPFAIRVVGRYDGG